MRDALFILVVVFVLAALSAIRYRRQISGVIRVTRMLRETTRAVATSPQPREAKSIPLVNCSKCGVWVPRNKAIKIRDTYYCSDACLASSAN